MRKRKSSQSKPMPASAEEEPRSHSKRELQLVTASAFRLPDGWSVEEKRRPLSNKSDPGKVDKYYLEPGTGLKFRSLPAVKRYLTEGQIETRTKRLKPGSESMCDSAVIMKKGRSPQSKPIPLLIMSPGEEEEEPSSLRKRQLQSVTTSPFRLPDGWYVEEKRRPLSNATNPGIIDKYYYEPGTGLKFRSLAAVRRYLTEGKIDTRTRTIKPGSECTMQITPYTTTRSSSFILPDDWEIEEKPRKNCRIIDKTYIEPGSGRRFRSLVSVERYLTEEANENAPLKALTPANNSSLSPGSCHQKMKSLGEIGSQKVVSSSLERNISGKNDRPAKLKLGNPPAKVKWVLAGVGGSMWNPLMDDSVVPDSVKQKWSETFISSIYGGNISAPGFKL